MRNRGRERERVRREQKKQRMREKQKQRNLLQMIMRKQWMEDGMEDRKKERGRRKSPGPNRETYSASHLAIK